jgi:uncharacterized repeat protein (TIGR01451 family)
MTFKCLTLVLMNIRYLFLLFCIYFVRPLPAQWQRLPGPTTGSVRCWTSTPDGVLYAGGTGGIFRSEDDGRHWQVLPGSAELGKYLWQLDWDKGNLYLLTQDFSASNRVLWKSSDEGTRWSVLRTDLFDPVQFQTVFDAREDTIVVNTHSMGHHSTDGGVTWKESANNGVWNIIGTEQGWFSTFYSTAYRWSREWPWFVTYQGANLSLHPVRLLAAGERVFMFLSGPGSLFKYTQDGGTSWLDANLPIAYNAQSISVAARQDTLFVQAGTNIYFSTDGLRNWKLLPAPNLKSNVHHCFFTNTGAIVALTDEGIFRAAYPGADFQSTEGFSCPNVLTALPEGGGRWWLGLDKGLFFSPDDGNSWQQTGLPGTNPAPEIRWIRRRGNALIAAGPERLYYSPNAGGLWTERKLPAANIQDVALLAQRIFIATCDSSWFSDDWGASWKAYHPNPGEPIFCNRHYAQNDSLLVHVAQWSKIFISRDTGVHWQDFSEGLGGLPYTSFETAVSSDTLYMVSGYRLMRSPLTAPAWKEMPLPLPVTAADGPWPQDFHFSNQQIRVGIPRVGVYDWNPVRQEWRSFAPVPRYNSSNRFIFSDSLSVMAALGGVWYIGNLSLQQLGGYVFADVNQNAVFDSDDTPLSGQLVELEGRRTFVASNSNGFYRIDWRGQKDSLRLRPFSGGLTVSPVRHRVDTSGFEYDFAVSSKVPGTDLVIDMTAAGPPRPGFTFELTLSCRNEGPLPAAARMCLSKDPVLQWVGFTEPPDLLLSDSVQWQFSEILPGESRRIRILFRLPADAALGRLLYFSGEVFTEGIADLRGENNRQVYVLQVVGSFDPNDKAVAPTGNISPAMVADTQQLIYTIRFQNTGTFPAEFVRITDVLAPGLDLGSFRFVASSHHCQWSLREREVEFFFPNIQLPDSMSNEPESHGFVKFSINLRSDLPKGAIVRNFADIFFDFNTPVRTNTIETAIRETSVVQTPPGQLSLHISPNPASRDLMVSWDSPEKALLQLFDAGGHLCLSGVSTPPSARLDVPLLPFGAYRLVVRVDGKVGEAAVLVGR